jgi:pseudaminic acid cytidylyltransferase
MRVAIIPARGGSKRIPRKNIKLFAGLPIIAYSIKAAQASGVFDRIIVTTDDEEIADVARRFGAEIPFMRPPELSDDHTATIPVIAHAIQTLQANGDVIDAACCIYATAPFIRSEDIIDAYNALITHHKQYAFPVTTFPFPIFRGVKRDEEGNIAMFWPQHFAHEVKTSKKHITTSDSFTGEHPTLGWAVNRFFQMQQPRSSCLATLSKTLIR